MFNKSPQKLPGFTMIEIVVVLFIVSIGILGVMSLVVQNIKSQSYDKNSIIAAQLAQEGIELVRHVRDSNWLKGQAFDTNLATTIGTSYQYYLDYQDSVPQVYSGVPAELVLKQNTAGYYLDSTANSALKTPFSRLITVKKLTSYSLQVDSTVTWQGAGRSYSYKLETLLYDWKQ